MACCAPQARRLQSCSRHRPLAPPSAPHSPHPSATSALTLLLSRKCRAPAFAPRTAAGLLRGVALWLQVLWWWGGRGRWLWGSCVVPGRLVDFGDLLRGAERSELLQAVHGPQRPETGFWTPCVGPVWNGGQGEAAQEERQEGRSLHSVGCAHPSQLPGSGWEGARSPARTPSLSGSPGLGGEQHSQHALCPSLKKPCELSVQPRTPAAFGKARPTLRGAALAEAGPPPGRGPSRGRLVGRENLPGGASPGGPHV